MEYELEYRKQFEDDIEAHKKAGQVAIIRKIGILLNELRTHPTRGTGNPESLKGNRKGQWSRRISQKHRLVYEIHDSIVTVIIVSAMGHYDEH